MRASKPHCLRSLHACFKTSLDVFPLTFVPSRQDKMQLPRKGAQPQRQLLQGERCLTKLPHTPTTRRTEVCLSWARFGVATAERVLARTRATAEPWRMLREGIEEFENVCLHITATCNNRTTPQTALGCCLQVVTLQHFIEMHTQKPMRIPIRTQAKMKIAVPQHENAQLAS